MNLRGLSRRMSPRSEEPEPRGLGAGTRHQLCIVKLEPALPVIRTGDAEWSAIVYNTHIHFCRAPRSITLDG